MMELGYVRGGLEGGVSCRYVVAVLAVVQLNRLSGICSMYDVVGETLRSVSA